MIYVFILYLIRFDFNQGLNVPISPSDKTHDNDQISNSIYMSVLKQAYNLYKLFNGTLDQSLNELGHIKLKEILKAYFDEVIFLFKNFSPCHNLLCRSVPSFSRENNGTVRSFLRSITNFG